MLYPPPLQGSSSPFEKMMLLPNFFRTPNPSSLSPPAGAPPSPLQSPRPHLPSSLANGRDPLPLSHTRAPPPPPSPLAEATSLLPVLPLHHDGPCMGDPASDHGFLYDEQGRVDILNSPFFDVSFGNDRTADEYVDRVIYQLTLALEDRLPRGPWYIVSNPLTSPNPTSPPATYTLRVTCLLVALLSALAIFSR
ncbi:hypothetical protein M5K25_002788 [Dendrobium thyrsiflorum]|uniref:Uncharacterized protein n=1 Tax=Dendrobium thyrsiflorum TaxID=117978 RepID=A0ABD0VN89_DENTH